MERFSILIQLRFIYIYFIIYTVVGYFYDSWLKKFGYYTFLENYFGVTSFFILAIMLLNIYPFFIGCKRKKMVYSIRMKFFIILVISVTVLWLMLKLGVPFEKKVADDELLRLSIDKTFYNYNLGLIPVFLFDMLLVKIKFLYLYIALYVLIFISIFFIVAKRVRITITKIIHNRREKKRLKIERQLIQEQIELMEMLEKRERKGNENDTSI